jgi:hypothetical protein
MRARPRLDGAEERLGGVAVLGREESEHRGVIAVDLVVEAIVDRCDAADDAIAAPGEEEIDVGVGEERIRLRREAFALRLAQRQHPVGITRVAFVRVVDEPAEFPPVADGPDLQHGSGRRGHPHQVRRWLIRRVAAPAIPARPGRAPGSGGTYRAAGGDGSGCRA